MAFDGIKMNWNPIHADHAIESVQVTAFFNSIIEPETFDELVVGVKKPANEHGLTNRLEMQEPINLVGPSNVPLQGVPPGIVLNIGPAHLRRRVIFRELSGSNVAQEFGIGAQNVQITTTRYRRWADFSKMTSELLETLQITWPLLTNIKTIRLQYVDRFRSPKGDADHFEVVSKDSPFVVGAIKSPTAAFHVHSGWFDFENGGSIRRLTNLNIDVNDIALATDKRDIGILTMGQYESLDGVLDAPLNRIGTLHTYLKSLFGHVVTSEAAERVSLNPV